MTQSTVEKAPALFRRAIDEAEIARRKEYNSDLAYQVYAFFGHAIDANTLALYVGRKFNGLGSSVGRFKGGRIDDDDFYFDFTVTPFDGAIDACEMVRGVPVDYFSVACSVKRVACSEHGYGFEQIGLALSIFSVEKKESRPERNIEMFVITKVVQ